jgi:hypothetical protein
MRSNLQPKKFALNVRRYGPQPSICVRSFSQITTMAAGGRRWDTRARWRKRAFELLIHQLTPPFSAEYQKGAFGDSYGPQGTSL